MNEAELERARDECLDLLSIENISWAWEKLDEPEKRRLVAYVGLKLNPRFVKAPSPLIHARLGQVRSGDRWAMAYLLRKRCLQEFARELGVAFDDPSLEELTDAIPTLILRCGSVMVKLTLLSAIAGESRAAPLIHTLLGDPRWQLGVPQEGDASAPEGASGSPGPNADEAVLLPVDAMLSRVKRSIADSDATYYSSLLLAGEMLTKIVTLALTACIDPERDEAETAYATQYGVIRADSIGVWAAAIQNLTTAPVYRVLDEGARGFHTSLTQRFGADSDAWQRAAIDKLNEAIACFPSLTPERATGKVALAQWFQQFAALRNKTRGHGADPIAVQSSAVAPLAASLELLINGLEALRWPWWYVDLTQGRQNKVYPLVASDPAVWPLTRDIVETGVYVMPGTTPRVARLLRTDSALTDFFLPNGDPDDSKCTYEEISYLTGEKRWASLQHFQRPPRALPASETEGSAELRAVGNVLTNLPEPRSDYVRRVQLEDELAEVLKDARHPVVAISGPGGIGKTSLALQVLHDLAEVEAFTAVLWFSARDIDLDATRGPLAVKPAAQSLSQIARQYLGFVRPSLLTDSSDKQIEHFLASLSEEDVGPILYVFDNFETVHNPGQLYRDLNEFVRLPNKILITTRYRDFKGDWPLHVEGMSRPEFDALVATSASRLNITGVLQKRPSWAESLYAESGGHPYVVNVALGEVARTRQVGQKFERIMASKDEILDALFERSFNRLSPQAQRVFFTLCRWRAQIPSIALEAVLTRPSTARMDVETELQHLVDSSLIERRYSEVDAESFLHVPAAAYRFGVAQMQFSDIADVVEEDAHYLHMFGAVPENITKTGFAHQVHRFYDTAERLEGGALEQAIAIGEYVARRYPESWLRLARLQRVRSGSGRLVAKSNYQSYLARRPDDADAWLELAELCGNLGDDLGELRAAAQASENAEHAYTQLAESLADLRQRCDSGALRVESKQKKAFLLQLCRGWHVREKQASLSTCFNLARLADRAGDAEEALYWADNGLEKDGRNQRLSEIRERSLSRIRGRVP